jgi:outer membrane protein TolC
MTEDRGRTAIRSKPRASFTLSPHIRRLSTVLCLLSTVSAPAADELKLEQAIEIALLQNRDLAALRLQLEGAYFGVDSAEAPFALTFQPRGGVQADDDSTLTEIGLDATKRFGTGGEVELGGAVAEEQRDNVETEKRALVRVELDQPLFRNFGTLVNREGVVRARNEVMSARRRIELEKTDLILRVVELHEDVLRLQQRRLADEQSYKRFDQLYRLTRVREQQGRTTRIDTLRAEFERGRAELSIAATTEELASRRRELADVLAIPLDTEFVARPGTELVIADATPDQAIGVALSNRLDYAEAIQDLRDAARGVAIAGRQLLPDLDLIARYEKTGAGPDASDARSLDDDAWFVGFGGDTDVPQRGARAELGRARIDEKTATQKLEILASAVGLQVHQALLAHGRAGQEVGLAARNRLLAENRARLARRMFVMGRADNFTVADAENGLLEAENDLLEARAELSVTTYRLLRTLGTLIESPEDLKPGALTSDG